MTARGDHGRKTKAWRQMLPVEHQGIWHCSDGGHNLAPKEPSGAVPTCLEIA